MVLIAHKPLMEFLHHRTPTHQVALAQMGLTVLVQMIAMVNKVVKANKEDRGQTAVTLHMEIMEGMQPLILFAIFLMAPPHNILFQLEVATPGVVVQVRLALWDNQDRREGKAEKGQTAA